MFYKSAPYISHAGIEVSAQTTPTQPTHHTPQQINMSVSVGYRRVVEAAADGFGRTRLPALTSRPTAAPAATRHAAALSPQRASKETCCECCDGRTPLVRYVFGYSRDKCATDAIR